MKHHISQEVIRAIIEDFNIWRKAERDFIPDGDYENSVLYALGSFNFAALNTETGVRVMKDVLNTTNELQGTAARLRRFVSSCMLKYGIDVVNQYAITCYEVLKLVYGVSDRTIDALRTVNDCAWVIIMFTIL